MLVIDRRLCNEWRDWSVISSRLRFLLLAEIMFARLNLSGTQTTMQLCINEWFCNCQTCFLDYFDQCGQKALPKRVQASRLHVNGGLLQFQHLFHDSSWSFRGMHLCVLCTACDFFRCWQRCAALRYTGVTWWSGRYSLLGLSIAERRFSFLQPHPCWFIYSYSAWIVR